LQDDEVLLFDAAQLVGNTDVIVMNSARHAGLVMDDAPSDGAANLVSLWQTNSKALRAERWFGAEVTGSSVAHLVDAEWGGQSSGT
jgi:hypothetical protein